MESDMNAKPYYTLCLWNDDYEQPAWYDEFGSYSRKEVASEMECYDLPRKHMAIIKTDGTAADMMAKRDALPAPKGRRHA